MVGSLIFMWRSFFIILFLDGVHEFLYNHMLPVSLMLKFMFW